MLAAAGAGALFLHPVQRERSRKIGNRLVDCPLSLSVLFSDIGSLCWCSGSRDGCWRGDSAHRLWVRILARKTRPGIRVEEVDSNPPSQPQNTPHKPRRKERERETRNSCYRSYKAGDKRMRGEDDEEIRAADSMVNCALLGAGAKE